MQNCEDIAFLGKTQEKGPVFRIYTVHCKGYRISQKIRAIGHVYVYLGIAVTEEKFVFHRFLDGKNPV